MNSEPSRPPNRLIHETSPYLLQHAYNPVDWHPWGPEALNLSRDTQKPILLSIGYSACHWCHVMEKESFEDQAIADLMNTHFVPIKVDREERPDLDEIYMQATIAMNQGNGGWPMTVFLTPQQEPIFAGTYFPPTDKWGRPGFSTILQKISEGWAEHREDVVKQASSFTSRLQASLQSTHPMTVGKEAIQSAIDQFAEHFEPQYGGFGTAPKFPPATGLSFLLGQYSQTQDNHSLHIITKTLDGMAAGGMYDHIGGGFSRYSTDNRWLVPHFEKMLYDNALLARTYVEAFQVTQNAAYQRVATDTFEYILREMTSSEGGFYSATDADSEGEEGKFFVWTPEQIHHIVQEKEEATRFCAFYDITQQGNWEGKSIPNTPQSLDQVGKEVGCSAQELLKSLDRIRPLIYQNRLTRVPPGLDDKIITAWNGMMIGALAEGSRVFGEPRYLTAASTAADFLLTTLSRPDGGLYRTYRNGKAHLFACLEDYAYLVEACIDIFEAGGPIRFLSEAQRLTDRMIADFMDQEQGGFYTTAHDHETLIIRGREGPDGATPSGNAVAAMALARLSFHFGRDDYREAAVKAIRAYGHHIAQISRGFAKSLIALDLLLRGPVELALIGTPGHSDYEALKNIVHHHFLPNRIIAHYDPLTPQPDHPLLRGKDVINGQAALFICQNFSCQAPITDAQEANLALSGLSHSTSPSPHPAISNLKVAGMPGHATPEGTSSYVSHMLNAMLPHSLSADGYTALGNTHLTTSRLGFGSYRVTLGNEEHEQALHQALNGGCNLIDTSTNYSDGGSEQLIGKVLNQLISTHTFSREQFILVSKIGYIQGHNLKQAEAREQAGQPYPEIVKYQEGLWHCLHPTFLNDQLDNSLDRLGLETLDICLLHNPEYFLTDAKSTKSSVPESTLQDIRREFYRRLQQAFVYFEEQVAKGRIQYYGVSSNTCTHTPDNPEATSLSHMLQAAQEAAKTFGAPTHHFRVLQLPMNVLEAGATLTPNTGENHSQTTLEFAEQAHIGILVNRPLNAILSKKGGLFRLADPVIQEESSTFETQLPLLAKLEEEYRKEFAPLIPYSGKGLEPVDFFRWSEELPRLRGGIQNLQHWEQLETQMIAPHINQVFQVGNKQISGDNAEIWQHWRDRYVPELLTCLKLMHREASKKNRLVIEKITNVINPLLPPDYESVPFAQKSLLTLTSTPGITCVLNGMRKSTYVEDALQTLSQKPLSHSRQIFEALHILNFQ